LRSIRSYLIAMSTVLVALVCAAAGVLIYEVDRYGHRQTEVHLLSTTRALSLVVDGELGRFEGMLQALRESDSLQRQDWSGFDQRARSLLSGPDAWIVIGARDGQQLVNTILPRGAPLPRAPYPAAIWQELDKGQSRICNLSTGAVARQILCIDVPVMRNGRAAYVLSIVMRPRQLRAIMDSQRLPAGTFGTIIDREGRLIWRTVNAEPNVGRRVSKNLMAAIRNEGEGVREGAALSGELTLAGFSRSARSGWTVIVGMPRGQARWVDARALYLALSGAVALLLLGAVAGLLAARRTSGAIRHLSDSALRIRDGRAPDYQPTGLSEIDAVGTALDEAFEARALHEERFNLAQEVGGIGAWDWDVLNDQGHVSDSYKAMHGLAHIDGPLSSAQLRSAIHPDDLEPYIRRLIAGRSGPGPSTYQYRAVHADGSVHWISGKGRRLFDAEGRFVRAVGIVRDVTAEHEAEQALAESQERLALATAAANIGIWDLDPRTGKLEHSDLARAIFGLPQDGTLTVADVVRTMHPDDRGAIEAQMARALDPAIRDSRPFEYRVIHPDGAERWVLVFGRVQFSGAERKAEAVRYTGTVIDITERKLAEEQLRRLNALLRSNVDKRTAERDRLWTISHDPFVVADMAGVWLAASPAWTALLGWTEEELIGRTSEWMEHPDDKAITIAEQERLAAGQVTIAFVNRFRAKDGSYRMLSWTSVPEGDRVYSVARDITEIRERAEALRHTEEALRQAQKMESIGQITGGLAHDFNNLLAPIVGTLDLLQQRGLPDPRSERLVAGAIEAAERARMLVQRLLAFARRQPLQVGPIDVAGLVEALRGLIGTTIGPRIELAIDTGDRIAVAKADANQLEMAILNLAVNARDAMPDGGRLSIAVERVEATAETAHDVAPGSYVSLRVEDNGVGMPPSVVERASEPFFSTKGAGRGTGLGLSMVHGLAAQLGGAMRISSELGIGTTIQLLLPVADMPLPEAAPSQAPDHAPRPVRATALLVDDETLVRASTAQMLMDMGYAVLEASSAAQALEMLDRQGDVEIVVTDHLMPEMTGTELARSIRAQLPDLPILIVSGYADVNDIASDFPRLLKPFKLDELRRSVARMQTAERAD